MVVRDHDLAFLRAVLDDDECASENSSKSSKFNTGKKETSYGKKHRIAKDYQRAIEAKQLSLFQAFFLNIKKDDTTTTENLNLSMIKGIIFLK